MKAHTKYLWFDTKKRREYINVRFIMPSLMGKEKKG